MRGRCRKLQSLKKIIPYGRHSIDKADRKNVDAVLKSNWLTQGPAVPKFEESLAKLCGAKYSVAVSSGTAALHLAALALKLSSSDEAITTPISFVATANSILYSNAKPVFADINPATFCLDPEKTKSKINAHTKVLLPVHFGGLPADMPSFSKIARRHHLSVIEDASHALGAHYSYQGKQFTIGSCKHSDAAIFSFHPVKMITTAEGGAITTNRKDLYEKLIRLRTHGITRNPASFQNKYLAFESTQRGRQPAPWYYEMQDLGFNYRMNDIQAALGISQLRHLRSWVLRRQEIAEIYNRALSQMEGLTPQYIPAGYKSSYHIYVVRLNRKLLGMTRADFFHSLVALGIRPQVHYIPIHLQPYYTNLGYRKGMFPNSERYYEETITLPLYPSMKRFEVQRVIQSIQNIMG